MAPSDKPYGMHIKQINDALERRANNGLKAQGLTMAQVTVLLHLNDLPDKRAPLKELEQFLHVAQSTAAGIVARLEQKGFVKGLSDPFDKRVKMVQMTDAGVACCLDSRDNIAQTEALLLSPLTPGEQRILLELLQKMLNAVK